MKIAICSESEEITGLVPKTFRDAQFLMIINADNNELLQIYPKEDDRNIGFAEHILEQDCEAVICGPMEQEPFDMIVAAGVTRYDGSSKKVQRAYDYMRRDRLPLIKDYIGGPGPHGHSHDYSCECGEEGESEDEIVEQSSFAAVISAAGMSSRMGDFKPLMHLGGQVNILREIHTFLSAGVQQVVIVTGNRADEISTAVEKEFPGDDRICLVMNPDYASTPMFESVKIGLKEAGQMGFDAEQRGIFFLPVDVPLFTKFTLDALIDRFSYDPKDICIPMCDGCDGHPILIRGNALGKVLNGDDRQGLRSVLAQADLTLARVDVPDPGCMLDADTPEEYRKLEAEIEYRRTPDDACCERLLAWAGVTEEGRQHGLAVAELAAEIAEACSEEVEAQGRMLNIGQIRSAALLHDLLKGMDQHAERAGEMLTELGMSEVGSIVGTHTTLPEEYLETVNENLIVYLADKLVCGSRRVSLDERFRPKREQYKFMKSALAGVEKRYQAACRAMELVRTAGWQ